MLSFKVQLSSNWSANSRNVTINYSHRIIKVKHTQFWTCHKCRTNILPTCLTSIPPWWKFSVCQRMNLDFRHARFNFQQGGLDFQQVVKCLSVWMLTARVQKLVHRFSFDISFPHFFRTVSISSSGRSLNFRQGGGLISGRAENRKSVLTLSLSPSPFHSHTYTHILSPEALTLVACSSCWRRPLPSDASVAGTGRSSG